MLIDLSIRHLTLVDELDLEFRSGMSVVTGETGAGKSIILGALGLALGDRADSSLLAADQDKAEVCATFDLAENTDVENWLSEKELTADGSCILRRVINRDGRSRAFINGSPVTIADLKSLGEMLLDIHSQHEHQSLLKKETHRRLVDEFGGCVNDGLILAEVWGDLATKKRDLETIVSDAEEQSSRVQLLSYQVDELEQLNLSSGETEQLENEQKRLASAEETRQKLIEAMQLCSDSDEGNAIQIVSRISSILNTIEDDSIKPLGQMIESALIQLEETHRDLESVADDFEADPERLHTVEERLGQVYETARKHKVNPDDIPQLFINLKEELDAIVNVDDRIAELEAEIAKVEESYLKRASALTADRRNAADRLEKSVTEHLQNLGMEGGVFTVSIEPVTPSAHGVDDIEFLITTNPGQEPASLNKIASGGELSRISLAIQVVTAKTSETPTLVFDEVDVGVGGPTAEVVGSLLRQLGADAQIICVTHLPQVAAQGHHHYVVVKATSSDGATTTMEMLNEEQKVDEIARMLGGIEKTDQSLAHAESMIAASKNS